MQLITAASSTNLFTSPKLEWILIERRTLKRPSNRCATAFDGSALMSFGKERLFIRRRSKSAKQSSDPPVYIVGQSWNQWT